MFDRVAEAPAESRNRLLGELCGADAALRREVESLLAADGAEILRSGRVVEELVAGLERPGREGESGPDSGSHGASRLPDSGDTIGPYRLLSRLGEGGMGQVYLSERSDGQFRQTVAVKLLRGGFESSRWIERFLHEREILARLEHPNIARLLDGGVTGRGLPYLVMEYVRGEPVTEGCDRRGLSIEDRLRLFREICAAVQYAHRNLVVHRDLKPSNILVNEDGEVKLLDFGIAKLIAEDPAGAPAAAAPAPTETALMTPAFASPEQIRGGIVTTATDVYALGLVLYELLVGERAQPVEELSPAALERRICEEEPEPASEAALVGTDATARADRRGESSPGRLARRLRGDLDTILAKAMAKEPARRYATPTELADDIDRHLTGQPVRARPDSIGYRAKKFVRRHRLGVAASAFALLALVGGLAMALAGVVMSRRAESVARAEAETAERVSEFLVELFRINEPGESKGSTVTARELLDRGAARIETQLASQPEARARLLHAIARAYGELGLFEPRLRALELELQAQTASHGRESPQAAKTLSALAKGHADRGEYEKAREAAREAVTILERAPEPDPGGLADALSQLGIAEWYLADLGAARRTLERALATKERLLGREHLDLGGVLNNVAILHWQEGNTAAARPLYERALAIFERELGTDHPNVARTLNNLALLHLQDGDLVRARALHERALSARRRVLAPDHPEIAESLNNLGEVMRVAGEYEAARAAFEGALEIRERALGPDHPNVATTLGNLGITFGALGNDQAARPLLLRAIAILEAELGKDHFHLGYSLGGLAAVERRAGNLELAESIARRGLALFEAGLGSLHPDTRHLRRELATILRARGLEAEAAEQERLAAP